MTTSSIHAGFKTKCGSYWPIYSAGSVQNVPALLHFHSQRPAKSCNGLFGQFSNADAMVAPICMRLMRYGLPVPPHIAAFMQRVQALPGVQAWIAGAMQEKDFLDFEEPYRLMP